MKLNQLKKELLRNPKFRAQYSKRDLAYEISKMLVEARVIKGVTQAELANLIKTKQTSIARAEGGKSLPRLSFLKKIADAFGTYLIPPKFGFMVNNISLSQSSDVDTTETSFPIDQNVSQLLTSNAAAGSYSKMYNFISI